jgi:nucleotide-binding universal stress UspA family protein
VYKKICIPLDNSVTDQTIIDHIISLAAFTKSELVLVHVADGFAARLQDQLNLEDSDEIKKDQIYLNQIKDELSAKGLKVKAVLVPGKEPADAILKLVEEEHCDLIAMSTHGHRFLKDVILGSVADNLRHLTDVPILMIRSSLK